MGALWAARGCICGICWGLWCALVGSTCQCVSWVFADVHWGMSMYTGSHYVALGHNMVGLWFLGLHCSFLLCIGGYTGGHVGGLCVVVCIASFFFIYLFCFFGGSLGCGFWLFTGPPSTLDSRLCFKLFI